MSPAMPSTSPRRSSKETSNSAGGFDSFSTASAGSPGAAALRGG
jgi:hypothetical protein